MIRGEQLMVNESLHVRELYVNSSRKTSVVAKNESARTGRTV